MTFGRYLRRMRKATLLLALVMGMTARAQGDVMESLSSHYAVDSLFFTVDTVRFDAPLATVKPKLEKYVCAAAGPWSKNEVRSLGGLASGRVEFTYMPDNLMEVSRAGYLSTFATYRWTDGMCIVRLEMWQQRPAVSSFKPDMSFGPIARGNRCSQNLCSMQGVSKCSEACNKELWPAVAQVRADIVKEVRSAVATK